MVTVGQEKVRQQENMTSMQRVQGKWAGRWIWAAVAQGLIATILTVIIVEPLSDFNINWPLPYSPSHVIAGGGGGTWMFTGYILYLTVGVIAVAVTAMFYFYFEGIIGKVYHGLSNYLAWGQYIFMNIGVAVSMLLMVYGGYMAGYVTGDPTAFGCPSTGCPGDYVHVHYLGPLVNPIGGFVILACVGALLGGLGYVLRSRMK
jgi:hypothetical protein